MENQANKQDQAPKVVSLFERKLQTSTDNAQGSQTESEKSQSSFNDEMRKNMDNAERLRKERLKANQGVLKSYRIKN